MSKVRSSIDDATRQLKGAGRPVNSENDRAAILAASSRALLCGGAGTLGAVGAGWAPKRCTSLCQVFLGVRIYCATKSVAKPRRCASCQTGK